MIEGVKLHLGGRDFIVPALNFKSIRTLEKEINLISVPAKSDKEAFSAERMDATCRIVHTAMQRNYPNVTREQVEDWIDLGNVADVIAAVLGVSGLTKVNQEEQAASGEAKSPSTGTGSMPESSPTPAGPGSTSTSA